MVMITVEIGFRSVSTTRDAESTNARTVGRITKLTSNRLGNNTVNNMGNKTLAKILARFSPTSIFTRSGGGRGSGKGSFPFLSMHSCHLCYKILALYCITSHLRISMPHVFVLRSSAAHSFVAKSPAFCINFNL